MADPRIRWLVGQCHVADSHRKMAAQVASGIKRWDSLPLRTRLAVLRQAIEVHRDNYRLYASVMSGTPRSR